MATRRRTKIPLRTLDKRSRALYGAVAEAVDALAVAERRERTLTEGTEHNVADLEATYPGLRKQR